MTNSEILYAYTFDVFFSILKVENNCLDIYRMDF